MFLSSLRNMIYNRRAFFVFTCILIFSLSLYIAALFQRSNKLYIYLNTEKKRGWRGIAHRADDTLGFAPAPNARAFHTFPIGPEVPMAYDKNGFRIQRRYNC